MKLFVVNILLIAFVHTPCPVGQRASSAQTPAGTERRKYVGLQIGESLPTGHTSKSHFLIPSKSGVDIPMDFGIREVSRGKLRMLWLERVTQRDVRGVPRWKVIDVLTLPRIGRNQVLAHSLCFIGGEYEPEVLAIFDYEDKEYFTRARRAWRANRRGEKFVEIPANKLRCENEGWGL